MRLKSCPPEQAASLLQNVFVRDGIVQVSREGQSDEGYESTDVRPRNPPRVETLATTVTSEIDNNTCSPQYTPNAKDDARSRAGNDVSNTPATIFNASNHVSADAQGGVGVFGLTSTHHDHDRNGAHMDVNAKCEEFKVHLVAHAALQRQKEFHIRLMPDVDGVPIELAMHLLDVHWNRPHHTFLLTYRPAIMRDLVSGGPHCSTLLINAIFASSSKYSSRISLRDDPVDALSAGGRFFQRCEQLIAAESPFGRPSIPTIVAFLLLGSSFVARGQISKGWAYSGFGFRMVFDMGLHLDCHTPRANPEEIEIRRRVFWGVFINDKMQSLYLGRPMAMHLQNIHCPEEFLDTLEELDVWMPYCDPADPSVVPSISYDPTPGLHTS